MHRIRADVLELVLGLTEHLNRIAFAGRGQNLIRQPSHARDKSIMKGSMQCITLPSDTLGGRRVDFNTSTRAFLPLTSGHGRTHNQSTVQIATLFR